jgi:hypothetical protein
MQAKSFERSADMAAGMESLQAKVLSMAPDEFVSHHDLQDLTGFEMPTIYQMIRRLNRELLKSHRLLCNVRGQGYKLATEDDKVTHADNQRLRAMRRSAFGRRVLQVTDPMQLSAPKQARFVVLLDKLERSTSYLRWNSQRAKVMVEKSLLQVRKTDEVAAKHAAIVDQIRKLLG